MGRAHSPCKFSILLFGHFYKNKTRLQKHRQLICRFRSLFYMYSLTIASVVYSAVYVSASVITSPDIYPLAGFLHNSRFRFARPLWANRDFLYIRILLRRDFKDASSLSGSNSYTFFNLAMASL